MVARLLRPLLKAGEQLTRTQLQNVSAQQIKIQGTHYRSGAIKPKPEQTPFGLLGVLGAVMPGLFIGAAISKSVANFLEENDLFVPSEDDDDDD